MQAPQLQALSVSHLSTTAWTRGEDKGKENEESKRCKQEQRMREINSSREQEADAHRGEEGRLGVEMKRGGGKSWFLGLCLPGSWDGVETNRQAGVWSQDRLFFTELAYLMTEWRSRWGREWGGSVEVCGKAEEQEGNKVVNTKWRKWETEEARVRAEAKQEVVTKSDNERRRKGDEARRWRFSERNYTIWMRAERMYLAPLCLNLIEFLILCQTMFY